LEKQVWQILVASHSTQLATSHNTHWPFRRSKVVAPEQLAQKLFWVQKIQFSISQVKQVPSVVRVNDGAQISQIFGPTTTQERQFGSEQGGIHELIVELRVNGLAHEIQTLIDEQVTQLSIIQGIQKPSICV